MATHMKLAWVSDLALQAAGGGSFAVNWHAYRQLARHFDTVYCGPVAPKAPLVTDWVSKLRRKILKLPGKFAYFAPGTLERNAAAVGRLVPGDARAIFFRSATPWCRCRPQGPYFVYLDVVFHTFFQNTFRPGDFEPDDLNRIWREEADFLEGAAAVFFESRWGLEQAREAYGLRGDHYHATGRGGVVEPPNADTWDGASLKLVTLAMKFRQKGGDLVLEAYRKLKPRFPGLTWHIIGGPPEGEWETLEGIVYEGVLQPDEGAGLARLRELLAGAFLLVHPTREDTNPLVLTEAAYFGCPSVSVRRFAIPELVVDGETGVLVDFPPEAGSVAAAIASLLEEPNLYRRMRVAARAHALEHSSWEMIGETIAAEIGRVTGGAR
jgi:glycosyltransferase involved in cell wall biosynthesis